jgi:Tfp pilus assembly protein PilO
MKQNISAEMGARIAMWIGILGIIAGAAFIFLVPRPTAASIRATQKQKEGQAQLRAAQAKKDFGAAHSKVVARTWSGGAEQVGPGALQSMNALAAKHRVKLSGFRPERSSQVSGLDFLPYSVTATGAYLDLVNFVRAIENPDTKLAVDSLQIASSEANSDQVIATIGITAYRVAEEAKHV